MKIIESYLDKRSFSRPGTKLKGVKAIVMHNIGVANQPAKIVQQYFNTQETVYASAHYVIDLDGTVFHCIPNDERAYHCGSSQLDPASGKVYTDKAREKFGIYAEEYLKYSPNAVTLGIELCHKEKGIFTEETIKSAIALVALLCTQYDLTVNDIMTHNEIVGWKECPLLWTKEPAYFLAFKEDVRRLL